MYSDRYDGFLTDELFVCVPVAIRRARIMFDANLGIFDSFICLSSRKKRWSRRLLWDAT